MVWIKLEFDYKCGSVNVILSGGFFLKKNRNLIFILIFISKLYIMVFAKNLNKLISRSRC